MWWGFIQWKLFRRGCFIIFMWFYQKLFGFDTHPDGGIICMKLYHENRSNLARCTRIVCTEQVRWGGGGAVADPGGRIGRGPPPPLFRPIFVFLADFCYFRARHRGIWIPGPPPLFTDPGSASGGGGGRSWKCACHVTQRKCDGVLFSGKCSEGVVSSFSCGFIKSYLALIPIRTAFVWSYIMKIVQILHAYCMYRAGKVGGGGTVADPGGRIGRGPPFFRPIFVFLADFCYFRARHRGIWIPGPPPPLFTDPGSASGGGGGRSWKCACHVTQRKCDGVLFSGKCSEGVVSSFSCGFIKSYLALIPIRTAFVWSYIMKIVQILHAYCMYMYRAG